MGKFFKLNFTVCALAMAAMTVVLAGEMSQVVKLTELPEPVQKTIQAEAGSGKGRLGEIERVQDEGETSYESVLIKGNQERSFSVAPDGKLLSWQMFMHELSPAVRKTVQGEVQALKGRVDEIDRVMDEGKATFEVDVTRDDKDISFTVAADGRLIAIDVELAETPAAVQKAIKQKTAGAVITEIQKNTEDETEVSYDVDAEKDGKTISFSVDATGKLLED